MDRLQGHNNAAIINSWMCPWLIAAWGVNFAAFDNAYAAMEMLSVVIVQHNLGGFTEQSFAEAVQGNRVALLAFTKSVLRTVGNFFFISCMHSAATVTLNFAGKAAVAHRKDMRSGMTTLLTRTREIENRREIVAAADIGFQDRSHKIISRESLGFLEDMCTDKGIIGEPVIFQTQEDKNARKPSIVGTCATDHEKSLLWIIGELHLLSCIIFRSCDILRRLLCRELAVLDCQH